MLKSDDLSQFVKEKQIAAEVIKLPVGTPTVAAAAEAVGVQPEQIIKSVLFMANEEPILVISSGLMRIGWRNLAQHLGISRKKLKMASAQKVLAITGYVVGSVPPFGHQQALRTIIEAAVLQQEVVYGGGGDIQALMRLQTAELQRVVGDEIVNLAREEA